MGAEFCWRLSLHLLRYGFPFLFKKSFWAKVYDYLQLYHSLRASYKPFSEKRSIRTFFTPNFRTNVNAFTWSLWIGNGDWSFVVYEVLINIAIILQHSPAYRTVIIIGYGKFKFLISFIRLLEAINNNTISIIAQMYLNTYYGHVLCFITWCGSPHFISTNLWGRNWDSDGSTQSIHLSPKFQTNLGVETGVKQIKSKILLLRLIIPMIREWGLKLPAK